MLVPVLVISFVLAFVAVRLLLSRFGGFALDRPKERAYNKSPVPRTRRIAVQLGSLAAAYRDHYQIAPSTTGQIHGRIQGRIHDPTELGTPPEPGTRQAVAYRLALAELEQIAPPPRPEPATRLAQAPSLPQPSRTRGPSLSR